MRPAQLGWSTAKLETAYRQAKSIGTAAAMVIHRGYVIAAWGDVKRKFRCHSVRKSIASALIGIAISKDQLGLDQTLADLDIDDIHPLSKVEKQARVIDLLSSRSGIYHAAAKEPSSLKRGRPERHAAKPGERFFYNNWDFNVSGILLEQSTGASIFQLFDEQIARPLGMQDYVVADGEHQLEPTNSKYPAYAFRLSARDLARFGWLYANHGMIGEKQVVPRDWIEESWRRHSEFSNGRGYGLMWWIYPAGSLSRLEHLNRASIYAAIGTGGQFVLVCPARQFVFVHRGDTDNDAPVSDQAIWSLANQILAACEGAGTTPVETGAVTPRPLPHVRPQPKQRIARPLEVARLSDWVGQYTMGPLSVRVHAHQNRLFGARSDGMESELLWEGDDRFFLRSTNAQIEFVRDDRGDVHAARITMNGRTMRAARVDDGR